MGIQFKYDGTIENLEFQLRDVLYNDLDWSDVGRPHADHLIEVTTIIRTVLLSKSDYDFLKLTFEAENELSFENYVDKMVVTYKDYVGLVPGTSDTYHYVDGLFIGWVKIDGVDTSVDVLSSSPVFQGYAENRMRDWLSHIDGVSMID